MASQESSVFVRLDGRLAQFKKEPTREYWEGRWAEMSDAGLARTLRPSRFLGSHAAFFRRHMAPGARVLEAGCGVGLWVRRLRESGYRVIGLDYARRTLIRSRRVAPDLVFTAGDLRRLPFPDASFDAHVSFGVLEHYIDGPQEILAEAMRILRPGGRLLASVPQVNRLREPIEGRSRAEAESEGYRFHQYYFTAPELKALLEGAGFVASEDLHPYSAHHGLYDGSPGYRRVHAASGPLGRAAMLLDYVPGLSQSVGHMLFAVGVRP
ncbi:MAG: class I SAM-dependent methyltransferase [Myxococcota bacterium]